MHRLYVWHIGRIFVLLLFGFLLFNTTVPFILYCIHTCECIDVLGMLLRMILSIENNVFGLDNNDGSIMYLIHVHYRSNYVLVVIPHRLYTLY